ncbi:uncharacterized protein LOC108887489 isoform X4 [Lates calcarifer]|uniref:Uncharacterized protein LOC108887489 isoform X4 n=1 Tax=Lates calcarifer TaxID=8187 RepID=A0AAJ8DQY2_LATCA|nr:uncharacterized protein LOC108887489 isoform X4 [Lates calcarifer]
MNPLLLIFILVLHFEAGICEGLNRLYHRPGHDVTLPCGSGSSPHTCSSITWIFNTEQFSTITEVAKGNVIQSSDRAARLRLNTDCSLLINSITAEDAGRYVCRQSGQSEARVYLNILTVSQSSHRDDEATLKCSLWRYKELSPCKKKSILWLDETGTKLVGEGDGYNVIQTKCVSVLTVKSQRGSNRRYTCQIVDEDNKVQIQADYTPVFTGGTDHLYIIIGSVVGVVVVVVVITAVLIKCRRRATATEGVQKATHTPDEAESSLTYVTVNHDHQRAPPKKKVKEENVTYSTIKTQEK